VRVAMCRGEGNGKREKVERRGTLNLTSVGGTGNGHGTRDGHGSNGVLNLWFTGGWNISRSSDVERSRLQ
jgi:hypothetical protein